MHQILPTTCRYPYLHNCVHMTTKGSANLLSFYIILQGKYSPHIETYSSKCVRIGGIKPNRRPTKRSVFFLVMTYSCLPVMLSCFSVWQCAAETRCGSPQLVSAVGTQAQQLILAVDKKGIIGETLALKMADATWPTNMENCTVS